MGQKLEQRQPPWEVERLAPRAPLAPRATRDRGTARRARSSAAGVAGPGPGHAGHGHGDGLPGGVMESHQIRTMDIMQDINGYHAYENNQIVG